MMGDGERWGGEWGLRENLNCFDYKSGFVIKTVQIFSKSLHSLQQQNKGKYLPPVNALLTTTTRSIPPSSPRTAVTAGVTAVTPQPRTTTVTTTSTTTITPRPHTTTTTNGSDASCHHRHPLNHAPPPSPLDHAPPPPHTAVTPAITTVTTTLTTCHCHHNLNHVPPPKGQGQRGR